MNALTIIGNLPKDPEKKVTQNGKTLAAFTVAVNQGYGENKTTAFFSCAAWEKRAEPIMKFLKKGSKVAVRGSVSARAYVPKDGGEPRAIMEVHVEDCEFLTTRSDADDSGLEKMDIGNGVKATVVDDPELPF